MSCQKDLTTQSLQKGEEIGSVQKISTPIFEPKESADDKEVFEKIKAFEARISLLQSGIESLQTNEMTPDDVVWNVEALMNARYAAADKPFTSQVVEKSVIRIPRNANNKVDENVLPNAVESIRQKLASHWTRTTNANKHIVLVDIEISPTESLDLMLEITDVIGLDIPESEPFSATDNWWWGSDGGKCPNGISTSSPRLGAHDILARAINQRYPKSSWLGFFTNLEGRSHFSQDYPNKPDSLYNNMRDCLFFHAMDKYPNYAQAKCINYLDMNWYYNNYFNLISTLKRQTSKDFSSIIIWARDHLHTEPDGVTQHAHLVHEAAISLGTFRRSNCRNICSPDLACDIVCLQ